jgi:PucR family transcriptional regulator, purine catabolism regulatory protein
LKKLPAGLSFSHALRLAFSYTVNWLSPPQGELPLSWVVISREEIQPGDIWLLPAGTLTDDLLSEAVRLGASGILAVGRPPTQRLNYNIGFPVALIQREESDLRWVQKELLTLVLDQRSALIQRGARIYAQLSQQAAGGGGLEGIAAALSSITSRGVIIQDKRHEILAQSATPDFKDAWEGVLQFSGSPDFIPESLRDRKRTNAGSAMLVTDLPGGLERIIAPIIVSDVARGYLSLVGLAGQLDALDQVAVEQGVIVCAVEMARVKSVRETEKRLRGDLLTALLEENLSPRDARLWIQALGMDPDQPSVALRFIWDSPTPPSRRRLETLVNGEIARVSAQVIANPLGAEVICFYILPIKSARPEAALTLAETILNQAKIEFPDVALYCGVGSPAEDIAAWRTSFRQAGQAMELSRRLGVRKPAYFSDMSVYRLLMQIEDSPELIAFQEEILGPLLAHEGSEDLLRTLSAYFEHNGNLSHTAESLFIHRNTLLYRMERIASISGLDLELPETRLAAQLALHIYRMRGATL